jgi:hypothetical protein
MSLTVSQDRVLALISAGFTASAAAQHAMIHRNTISNWLQTSEFRSALERARAEKALLYRDEAEALAAEALGALRAMLNDPATPAAIRYKAAVAMLNHATELMPDPVVVHAQPTPEIVHKNAQSETVQPAPEPPQPFIAGPKIGRNELCPCGSGIKFKRCCIAKAENAPAA